MSVRRSFLFFSRAFSRYSSATVYDWLDTIAEYSALALGDLSRIRLSRFTGTNRINDVGSHYVVIGRRLLYHREHYLSADLGTSPLTPISKLTLNHLFR